MLDFEFFVGVCSEKWLSCIDRCGKEHWVDVTNWNFNIFIFKKVSSVGRHQLVFDMFCFSFFSNCFCTITWLPKPEILMDFSEHGKPWESSCAISAKNYNKQNIFCSSFIYLCKTAVLDLKWTVSYTCDMVRVWRWVTCLLAFIWNDPWSRSLLQLLFVVTYLKVSLWHFVASGHRVAMSSEHLICQFLICSTR